MVEVIVACLLYLVTEAVIDMVQFMVKKIRNKQMSPQVDPEYQPTATDQSYINQIREYLVNQYPEGIETRWKDSSLNGRLNDVEVFTQQVAEILQLDQIKIMYVTGTELKQAGVSETICGFYQGEKNVMYLNVEYINCNNTEIWVDVFDTILHELRHGYQYQQITLGEQSEVDEATRNRWADNIVNYVPAAQNPRQYFTQPIEQDARCFAGSITAGIKRKRDE